MSKETWIPDGATGYDDSVLAGKSQGNILRFLQECIPCQAASSEQDSDAVMAILMDYHLEAAVVVYGGRTPEASRVPCRVQRRVASQDGRSVGESLLDPTTPVSVLKEIKQYYQRLARDGECESDRRVATAIYFCAIASALVFHGERITSYSPGELADATRKIREKPWIDPDLNDLLARVVPSPKE